MKITSFGFQSAIFHLKSSISLRALGSLESSTGTETWSDAVRHEMPEKPPARGRQHVDRGRCPGRCLWMVYTTSQVAPESYGWPSVCHPPASDAARQPPDYPEGAILVIDVSRATHDPASAVLGAVAAGCNPVRLVTSPSGDVAYVSARTDNAILAFDTAKLLVDPAHARIGRVPVGDAPVGIAVFNTGTRLAVTNSNRFGSGTTDQSLTLIDATQIVSGDAAIIGSVPAGVFPRELTLSADKKTLFLTNFGSKNLAVIDVARLPLETRRK